jgi:hypothetical protein
MHEEPDRHGERDREGRNDEADAPHGQPTKR